MPFPHQHIRALVVLGVCLALVIGLTAILTVKPHNQVARASSSQNVSGFAWSDTIGWISFNCTATNSCDSADYGVHINESTGAMSGHAWSSTIGWISFNAADLSGCPTAPCTARASSNELLGWAKALSANSEESGGWDGWISLNGDEYGVTVNDTSLEGYAWGSTIIGWVFFNAQYGGVTVAPSAISASLSASPNQVPQGGSSTLTWTSANATSCSGSGFSTGGASSGSTSVSPSVKTTYTLSCENPFNTAQSTIDVFVSDIECSDGLDNDADGKIDYSADLGCASASDNNEDSASLVEVSITSSQPFVSTGGTVTISWTATGVSSCTVSGTNGDSWSGTSGAQTTSAITESTTYTLSCLDVEGDPTASQSVTVSLTPVFEEF